MSLVEINTKLAGVTFDNDDGSSRQEILAKCEEGEILKLIHSPLDNNPEAVSVFRENGEQIGWLRKNIAKEIFDLLSQGIEVSARISEISGGTDSKPTIGSNILISYDIPDLEDIKTSKNTLGTIIKVNSNMPAKHCANCGTQLPFEANFCAHCGSPVKNLLSQPKSKMKRDNIRSEKRKKNMLVSYLLLVLFGWVGAHKFYVGKPLWGVVYLALFIIGMETDPSTGFGPLEIVGLLILVDIFTLPYQIKQRNKKSLDTGLKKDQATRPKIDTVRPDNEIGLAAMIDVETTGLNSAKDKIIEFAVVLFSFNRVTGEILEVVDQYCGLQDPKMPIPTTASKVNGISDEDVRGKRLDKRKIASLLSVAEFVVAHNAKFDRSFVEQEFPFTKNMRWLCTCYQISWLDKGFDNRKLDYLLECHSIQRDHCHRALDDARATLELISLQNKNTTYFSELLSKAI